MTTTGIRTRCLLLLTAPYSYLLSSAVIITVPCRSEMPSIVMRVAFVRAQCWYRGKRGLINNRCEQHFSAVATVCTDDDLFIVYLK